MSPIYEKFLVKARSNAQENSIGCQRTHQHKRLNDKQDEISFECLSESVVLQEIIDEKIQCEADEEDLNEHGKHNQECHCTMPCNICQLAKYHDRSNCKVPKYC